MNSIRVFSMNKYHRVLVIGVGSIGERHAGELLVQFLAARGHRRIGLLLGEAGRAGTEHLLNGVLAGIHAAGLSAADLVARFYPGSKDSFMAQVRDMLSMHDRPTGVITDSGYVDWLKVAAEELGLSIPEQVDLGCIGFTRCTEGLSGCPQSCDVIRFGFDNRIHLYCRTSAFTFSFNPVRTEQGT
jgi:DNA-binding LacI/PurR family transcriptional regulator